MLPDYIDPELLQDFLTECNELVEKLDADLVELEGVGSGEGSQELLDGIFRALHTIKGSAGFLALTPLTTFAHAAEDALNRMRKGEVQVTTSVMDALLRSVDVLRGMLEETAAGQDLSEAPDDLMGALKAIISGDGQGQRGEDATAAPEATSSEAPASQREGSKPLNLHRDKAGLVEFMISDLDDASEQLGECVTQARTHGGRVDASEHILELAQGINKTAVFFDLESLSEVAGLLTEVSPKIVDLPEDVIDEVLVRIAAIRVLIDYQSQALSESLALTWQLETLSARLRAVADGESLESGATAEHHGGDPGRVLEIDGVIQPGTGQQPTAQAASPSIEAESSVGSVAETDATTDESASQPTAESASKPEQPTTAKETVAAKGKGNDRAAATVEQTIRVEVGRLEALLNLVGQLVLSKNRMMGLSRKLREFNLPHEVQEDFTTAASDLDRLTGELQVGVMRTRMQPLSKLFDRYPRVIRDMARMTGKQINLEVVGKETEVDKTVLELLADPLVHLLRNSADHGVEPSDEREAAGKNPTGRVLLAAEHQGSHVRVELTDDGRGLDREKLGRKAIERGLVTEDQLQALSDEDVFRFIFHPGFSTAEQVSDLSGRGVGMDVVRTNIAKLNGMVNIRATKDRGTTIEILIPLTVAIMPAMLVGVGRQVYAVPLASITEIVKPESSSRYSVRDQQVMTLRETVMPLLDLRPRLQETGPEPEARFAVVVGVGKERVGLVVDRLIGQEEVVIKSLDDEFTSGGPFSGATIREDGSVSLIIDVIQLIRDSQSTERRAA